MLSGSKSPSVAGGNAISLDTSVITFAVDTTGKQVRNPTTGEPVQIARDTITGKWFEKIADSMPHFGPNSKTKMDAVKDVNGVHVPHDNEQFRGVWAPMPIAAPPVAVIPATKAN